jgi:hypothetical protein
VQSTCVALLLFCLVIFNYLSFVVCVEFYDSYGFALKLQRSKADAMKVPSSNKTLGQLQLSLRF